MAPPLAQAARSPKTPQPRHLEARAARLDGWWNITVAEDYKARARVRHLVDVNAAMGDALASHRGSNDRVDLRVHIYWYTVA
jgi:hypothetical protein